MIESPKGLIIFIYNIGNISTFLEKNPIDNNIIPFVNQLREILIQDNRLSIENQPILTENDLKCILFYKIKRYLNNIPFQIHSEEADKICISNDYCIDLTELGDIAHENTQTRKTDISITLNATIQDESIIRKGHTLSGDHIDIELKYIRKGYSHSYLRDIRRDLCKLKYLVDPDSEHLPNQGENKFGIFILGFNKLSILERFLNEGLSEQINIFNSIENVCILLVYNENN